MTSPTPPTDRHRLWHRLRVTAFVSIIALCLLWLVWLAGLTTNPNATVNRVMNTAMLDSGLFWLFIDSPLLALSLGVAGLGCAAAGHFMVLWQLFNPTQGHAAGAPSASVIAVRNLAKPKAKPKKSPEQKALEQKDSEPRGPSRLSSTRMGSLRLTSARLTSSGALKRISGDLKEATAALRDPESQARKRMAVITKVVDLAVQCVLLVQLMQNGISISLLALFAAAIASNALCTAAFVSVPYTTMGALQLVVDFLFDLFIAVIFPLIVLCYAFLTFHFDRELMEINFKVFPPGSFEHAASVIANPVEVASVRHSIDSLRIDSVAKAFTRVGTNIALAYHAYQLAKLLRKKTEHRPQPSIYPVRNRPLAAFFVVFAVLLLVFTERSITTSTKACAPHPECAQIARNWIFDLKQGDLTRCPCIAVIDRDITLSRYDDMMHPPNRTEKIAQLATSGYLQTLQIVNRDLAFFPEQLQRCKGLRFVSMYYAGGTPIPDWFRNFTRLEFLHIEGQGGPRSMQALPDGLFDKMDSLSLIHLASHAFAKIPSLDNLVNLKSLNLAVLRKVETLPSFDSLKRLERLVFNSMVGLITTPNLDHLHNLHNFVSADRGAFCCNGFLGPTHCNLTHSLCKQHPLFRTPPVTQCLPASQQASEATVATFDKFKQTACFGEAQRPGTLKGAPTKIEMDLCNGTMFRECRLPGSNSSAMCYNARWMAVACDPTPYSIEMRRQQIAQKRGTPCDRQYEAWLGCGKA